MSSKTGRLASRTPRFALEAGGTAQVFQAPDGDLIWVHRPEGCEVGNHARYTVRELRELIEAALALVSDPTGVAGRRHGAP